MGDVHSRLKAVILCGGKSSRFGSDKARALVGGVPQLVRIVGVLRSCGLEPIAQADVAGKYGDLGIMTRADKQPGQGPLGGIATALTELKGCDVLVLTCDMPFVGAASLLPLIEAHKNCQKNIFYGSDTDVQPFPGIFSQSALSQIQSQLRLERLGVKECIETMSFKKIFSLMDTHEFSNINTQMQLQEVLCRCPE